MHHIVILLSSHTERGAFNSTELANALEKVGPEVIFLEHSPAEYEVSGGLEKKAIEIYRAKSDVVVVPCGIDFTNEEMINTYRRSEELFRTIEVFSSESYRNRFDLHSQREDLKGFTYLHSAEYGEEQRWIQEEECRIIDSTGNPKAYKLYRWWIELQRDREAAIVQRLLEEILNEEFIRVALVIGSEHRDSILECVKSIESSDIKWECYEC